jgi:hypothetical protein
MAQEMESSMQIVHSQSARSTRRTVASRPNPQDFMALRPMLCQQRQPPAAVCTRCEAISFKFVMVDQPCERVHHGSPCRGVLSCVPVGIEWRACTDCDGTGWYAGMVCMHCQSLGWRLQRKHS